MNRRTLIHPPQRQSIDSLPSLANDLRRKVTSRLMREFGVLLPPSLIRRVLDEASELAQDTGFPNLFFPALAEEKARVVFASLRDPSFDQAPQSLRHAA